MDISSSGQMIGRAFRTRIRLVLFFVFAWLGVVLLLAFLLNEGRHDVERKAHADALSVTSLLEARLAATMLRLQGDLEHLAASLPRVC